MILRINTFNMKSLLNFLVKIVIQNFVSNLMHFQGEMFHLFLKNKVMRSESVKTISSSYKESTIEIQSN